MCAFRSKSVVRKPPQSELIPANLAHAHWQRCLTDWIPAIRCVPSSQSNSSFLPFMYVFPRKSMLFARTVQSCTKPVLYIYAFFNGVPVAYTKICRFSSGTAFNFGHTPKRRRFSEFGRDCSDAAYTGRSVRVTQTETSLAVQLRSVHRRQPTCKLSLRIPKQTSGMGLGFNLF